jgi:hypothetical protein
LILFVGQPMIAEKTEIPDSDAERRAQIVNQLDHRLQDLIVWHGA